MSGKQQYSHLELQILAFRCTIILWVFFITATVHAITCLSSSHAFSITNNKQMSVSMSWCSADNRWCQYKSWDQQQLSELALVLRLLKMFTLDMGWERSFQHKIVGVIIAPCQRPLSCQHIIIKDRITMKGNTYLCVYMKPCTEKEKTSTNHKKITDFIITWLKYNTFTIHLASMGAETSVLLRWNIHKFFYFSHHFSSAANNFLYFI